MIHRLCATFCLFLVLACSNRAAAQEGIAGRWTLSHRKPGVVEVETVQLTVVCGEGVQVTAEVSIPGVVVPFAGTFDPATGVLALEAHKGDRTATITLTLKDGRLRGSGDLPIGQLTFEGERTTEVDLAPDAVPFDEPRPRESARKGLSAELDAACHEAIRDAVQQGSLVGVSVAIVVDGILIDVLSQGWADYELQVPASARTRYRWASASKPLTAVAALQLVETRDLDLYRDTRELVPEYDKGAAITPQQLLAHQAGLPHYEELAVRTVKEYEVEHPFADRILALDMFNETDLLFEPGYAFRYSTPGYVLLGAVIERAGGRSYAEQVRTRIAEPLGMSSLRPDYSWEEVEGRAAPYQSFPGHALRQSPDDISWKLPAGGWMSTAEDMGRFAVGLMGEELLDVELRDMMCTMHTDYGNGVKGYGYGINVARWDGHLVWMHGGGQVGASTYLLCSPETGHAVAVLANTEGEGVSDLAFELLERLLD